MPFSHAATYDALLAHSRETALLASIESLLGWDERTQLPPAGNEYRAEQMTHLAGIVHQKRTDPRLGDWLAELADSPLAADPTSDSGTTIRELKRQYDKKIRLPQTLVEELTRTAVLAQHAWVEARAKDDFASFRPLLEKMFVLKRQEAAALSDTNCLYDALLDEYEPLALTADVSRTLAALRAELVPLVAEIRDSGRQPPREILTRRYPIEAQRDLGMKAAARVGFDFTRGRLDVTHHPFCTGMGPHDHRITTRYEEEFFPCAFFGTLHEAGHGMYDQGLPTEQYGLPLGDALSLGIHESQSRMWENLVGRSRPFWEHFYADAQRAFPAALGGVPLDDFYFAINDVRPTLIRVEADEATYNLHILVRFELEQALINEDLKVVDLPAAWHEKYRQYLGVSSPNDADGVLQDIHWSAGLVGYFATYSLGNLYTAQFFEQADGDLGGLHKQFARGEFQPLLHWLQQHIHVHGKRYTATDLVQRVTGKPLSHGVNAALAEQTRPAIRVDRIGSLPLSRLVSLFALIAIAVVIGVVFFQVMVIFLVPMFLAVVLVIIFKPLHERFCRLLRGRERIAAGVTTVAILLIVLIPLALVLSRAAAEGWSLVSRLDQESMALRIRRLRTSLDLELPPSEVVNALKEIGTRLDHISANSNPGDDQAAIAERHRILRDLAMRRAKVVRDWVEKVGVSEKYQNPGFLARWSGADGSQLIASTDAMSKQLEDLEQMDPDDFEYLPTLAATMLAHRKVERQLLGDDLVFLLRSKANPTEDDLKQLRDRLQATLAPAAISAAPVLGKVFFGGLIMVVALYYFLADGPAMISAIMRLSPLDEQYEQQLLNEFGRISRAVVVATLLTALVQGALAGIGFRVAGLQAVFLLSVLTMVGAIIPFVGAAAVWIPAALWLVFEGYLWQGTGLALYGLLIISTSDNIIKPMILHGQSNLHPLLALVSVLGGVVALGPIGVFVGPMAVVFLQVVLQMLNNELLQLGRLGPVKGEGDKPLANDEVPAVPAT